MFFALKKNLYSYMNKNLFSVFSLICLGSLNVALGGFEAPATLTPQALPQAPTLADLVRKFQATRDQIVYQIPLFRQSTAALTQTAAHLGFQFAYDTNLTPRANLFNYYTALRGYAQAQFPEIQLQDAPLEADEMEVIINHIKMLYKSLAEAFIQNIPGANLEIQEEPLSPQEAVELIKKAIENAMNCALNIGGAMGLACPPLNQDANIAQRLTHYQNQLENLVKAVTAFNNFMGQKAEEQEHIIEEEVLPPAELSPLHNGIQEVETATPEGMTPTPDYSAYTIQELQNALKKNKAKRKETERDYEPGVNNTQDRYSDITEERNQLLAEVKQRLTRIDNALKSKNNKPSEDKKLELGKERIKLLNMLSAYGDSEGQPKSTKNRRKK